VTGVSTFVSVTITSLTRLRALHVDTSHATTLTGHDEEALNEQAATTQPGNVPNRPGKINAPVDRPGPHGVDVWIPLALVLMILTGAMLYMAFKRRRWL
jgi:hypothetical protein